MHLKLTSGPQKAIGEKKPTAAKAFNLKKYLLVNGFLSFVRLVPLVGISLGVCGFIANFHPFGWFSSWFGISLEFSVGALVTGITFELFIRDRVSRLVERDRLAFEKMARQELPRLNRKVTELLDINTQLKIELSAAQQRASDYHQDYLGQFGSVDKLTRESEELKAQIKKLAEVVIGEKRKAVKAQKQANYIIKEGLTKLRQNFNEFMNKYESELKAIDEDAEPKELVETPGPSDNPSDTSAARSRGRL